MEVVQLCKAAICGAVVGAHEWTDSIWICLLLVVASGFAW